MKAYQDLLRRVLAGGELLPTRAVLPSTGQPVRAVEVFGEVLDVDLAEGFPLLTTKDMSGRRGIHPVAVELAAFLRGDTDAEFLRSHGVTIWDEWCSEGGVLGPIYGHAWRNFGGRPRVGARRPQVQVGDFCGIADSTGAANHPLGPRWKAMIQRCYDRNNDAYSYYGARGVQVCDRWLSFGRFAEDAPMLPGWPGVPPDSDTHLDKDQRGDGLNYGPDSCCWLSRSRNTGLQRGLIYRVQKDGVEYTFDNASEFAREHGLSQGNLSAVLRGARPNHKGFTLVSVSERGAGVDQVDALVRGIREVAADPGASCGRRLILSAWDVRNLKYMALPPCHVLSQYHVRRGRLSCQVYQRSADLFLGVPFNIASYALLTHLLARETGLLPGRLRFAFGSAHIYENHLPQVYEQLSRTPFELPTLDLAAFPAGHGCLEAFQAHPEKIHIWSYLRHGRLSGEVAV